MNTLLKSVEDYLALRRNLGFKLHNAGITLTKFAAFMDSGGAPHITTNLAIEWVHKSPCVQPETRAERLGHIRSFARYYVAIDSQTEIPPPGLLPFRKRRSRPYLYSDEEIKELLRRALELPKNGLRPWTYYCLFGLLSVTGLRVREAIQLQVQDVNLQDDMLTVRNTKFGKSRLVPIHPSTGAVLIEYLTRRNQYLKDASSSTFFFVTRSGNHLDIGDIHRTFYKLSRQIGLRTEGANHGPRIHDLRHRFAVQTLLQWYASGEDAENRLPILSTYLGHAHVEDTYWYLNNCPELMTQAVTRLEQSWGQIS